MPLCSVCSKQNREQARFCGYCGRLLQSTPSQPVQIVGITLQALSSSPWLRQVPGFRSGQRWKQTVAVIGYSFIAFTILAGTTFDNAALLLLGVDALVIVLLATDAWGLRSWVPLLNSPSKLKAASGWSPLLLLGFVALSSSVSPPSETTSIAAGQLLGFASQETQPSLEDPGQNAEEWLELSRKTLTSSHTAEWDATLEVLEAPRVTVQERKYAFHVGPMRYHFRVKGNGRAYWAEQWAGKRQIPTREAWYEGFTYYVRSTQDPKKLLPLEVGEGEGSCIKRSLVEAGILGWRLAHFFDNEQPSGGYVTARGAEWVREETLRGRPSVVLDLQIGFGFGPISPRFGGGTSRLWIDRETLLPLQRETHVKDPGGKPSSYRVREVYTNWKLNPPLADETFHVEGMGPPDALVDAPEDPAAFEAQQTQKFLGFDVRDFPQPQGPTGFDELPAEASEFAFSLVPQQLSGPEPRSSYDTQKRIVTKGPDGSEIEAYLGYGHDKDLAPGHPFQSTRENRRRFSVGGEFHPQDVFIGKRVGGQLQPTLFFRDVDYDAALAMDSKGRCHLVVCDVDRDQRNRFKFFWLIGDLSTGKWTDAWLVDHRDYFTQGGHPWSAAWGETVHLIWDWTYHAYGEPHHKDSGIFHVTWTPGGFGRKVRVYKGNVDLLEKDDLDMAVDPDSGQLLLVFSTQEGTFVASRPAKGEWTLPARLHPEFTRNYGVSVQALGKGAFVIRTRAGETKEWLLTSK